MRLFNGVEALAILFVLVWVTGLFSALRSVGGSNAGLAAALAGTVLAAERETSQSPAPEKMPLRAQAGELTQRREP